MIKIVTDNKILTQGLPEKSDVSMIIYNKPEPSYYVQSIGRAKRIEPKQEREMR